MGWTIYQVMMLEICSSYNEDLFVLVEVFVRVFAGTHVIVQTHFSWQQHENQGVQDPEHGDQDQRKACKEILINASKSLEDEDEHVL